jgi:hypothetical protein
MPPPSNSGRIPSAPGPSPVFRARKTGGSLQPEEKCRATAVPIRTARIHFLPPPSSLSEPSPSSAPSFPWVSSAFRRQAFYGCGRERVFRRCVRPRPGDAFLSGPGLFSGSGFYALLKYLDVSAAGPGGLPEDVRGYQPFIGSIFTLDSSGRTLERIEFEKHPAPAPALTEPPPRGRAAGRRE